MDTTDLLQNPLSKFNHTFNNKDGILKLLKTINKTLDNDGLKDDILSRVFEKNYEDLANEIKKALANTNKPLLKKEDFQVEMIKEILINVRQLETRFNIIESKIEAVNVLQGPTDKFMERFKESVIKRIEQDEYINKSANF